MSLRLSFSSSLELTFRFFESPSQRHPSRACSRYYSICWRWSHPRSRGRLQPEALLHGRSREEASQGTSQLRNFGGWRLLLWRQASLGILERKRRPRWREGRRNELDPSELSVFVVASPRRSVPDLSLRVSLLFRSTSTPKSPKLSSPPLEDKLPPLPTLRTNFSRTPTDETTSLPVTTKVDLPSSDEPTVEEATDSADSSLPSTTPTATKDTTSTTIRPRERATDPRSTSSRSHVASDSLLQSLLPLVFFSFVVLFLSLACLYPDLPSHPSPSLVFS